TRSRTSRPAWRATWPSSRAENAVNRRPGTPVIRSPQPPKEKAMLKKILAFVVMLYAAVAMAAAAAVDVNKATDAQLDAVKGIGPATSKTILAERKKGEFKDWNDFVSRVKGIGDKKAEALSKEG